MSDEVIGICQVCKGINKIERQAEHLSCVWCDDGSIGELRLCDAHWQVWARICLLSVLERLKVQVHVGANQYEYTEVLH